jgi:hypothetical protein
MSHLPMGEEAKRLRVASPPQHQGQRRMNQAGPAKTFALPAETKNFEISKMLALIAARAKKTEYQREYRKRNNARRRPRLAEYQREYRKRHRARMNELQRERRKRNPARIAEQARQKNNRARDRLTDYYVRHLLQMKSCLKCRDFPPEIVEVKREHLRLLRAIRKQTNENHA